MSRPLMNKPYEIHGKGLREQNLCEQTNNEQTKFKVTFKSHIFVSRPLMSKLYEIHGKGAKFM